MNGADAVLVVDDDADVRGMLLQILDLEGVPAVGAANGLDAMALLREGLRPRLILLDLMMPVMNGWEFVAAQRREPALRDIPVVVLSADNDTVNKARELHVAASLRKPVELDTLLALVGERRAPPPQPWS